ncbi:fatty acid desaturase [bacterium]|nr:fatty acid desaturase [bacterium]
MSTVRKKNRYYYKHIGDLRKDLREALPRELLVELHRPKAWRHFLTVGRQLLLLALGIWLAVSFDALWAWLPGSVLIGFIVFDFTTLLHEVIHKAVFAKRRPFWYSVLGWLYALPSGISRTQFTTWHLDHHDELGSWTDDPKRAHLTPRNVKRWVKLLYMTPALFPIYFRAAAKECSGYKPELQNVIAFERKTTIATHLCIMALLIFFAGFWTFFKVYAVPYFFIFPIAFTINRVGQHYSINPDDPAQWTTLMKSSWFWDFVYLNSNYHLEHHYFPGVPFYHLPRLQKELEPFYQQRGMKYQTYCAVLYGWFVQNHAPHTNWEPGNEDASSSSMKTTSEMMFP